MNDIRKLDFAALQAFSVLLEEGNVSRTAQRLSLTQPTVSGMLARLREAFDDPLFVRTRHGVLPTPRAEALRPRLERLLQGAEELLTPPRFDPSSLTMDVRVSANDYMQSTLVAPWLGRLRSDAPGVRVAVRPMAVGELAGKLAAGEVDLALTIPQFADPGLRTKRLYREDYVGVMSSSSAGRTSRMSLRRFLAAEHVLMSQGGNPFRGVVDDALSERGAQRRIALSVPSFQMLLDAVRHSNLIATVPRRLVREGVDGLRTFELPVTVDGFDVIAAWHERQHSDPAHRWLRALMARVAQSPVAAVGSAD